MHIPIVESETAEVAIWKKPEEPADESNWVNFGSDTVRGWCTSNDVAKIISVVFEATSIAEIELKLQALRLTQK